MAINQHIKGTCAALMMLCSVLAGCGGKNGRTVETSSRQASDSGGKLTPEGSSSGPSSTGRIVETSKVPSAIKHLGLQVVLRADRTPPQFVGAVYGTAHNSHGTGVNFGIFLSGDQNASRYFVPTLRKLVPGATREGSTSGESYIAITSAGRGGSPGSLKAEEELTIAGKLQERVAGLARKALEEEGP
jgi:hypothetical protein